jgi:hypothetical protein
MSLFAKCFEKVLGDSLIGASAKGSRGRDKVLYQLFANSSSHLPRLHMVFKKLRRAPWNIWVWSSIWKSEFFKTQACSWGILAMIKYVDERVLRKQRACSLSSHKVVILVSMIMNRTLRI